jgi:beta-1,4-mannosyltransferase
LFVSLANQFPSFGTSDCSVTTTFTRLLPDGKTVWRNDRPGLIVSSTSWTEDEDFSILLSALQGNVLKPVLKVCGGSAVHLGLPSL